ncbi:MAG: hypothetical protein PHI19_06310, partial [Clostridia bacterium]|nr:hypothetical protein [Clostridia bacterium]
MNKRFASLAKNIAIVLGVCIFLVGFTYISVFQSNDCMPAKAAFGGTLLDTGKGMQLGINYLRTAANTSDGNQTGTGVYDGLDIYTDNGTYAAGPNELLYRPSTNGLGIHAKIKFDTASNNYLNNNLYNAIKDTASNDFVANASLSFNISVKDGGATTATVNFFWSPTGNTANETVATRTVALDGTNTFVQNVAINNLSNASMNGNAYFRMSIIFTGMASPAEIRVAGFVMKADTTISEEITINSSSYVFISGEHRNSIAMNTNDRGTYDYENRLADTFVKAGDTITMRTKVFKGEDTSVCYELPDIYSKVFDDGGISGTDPDYGVFWQNYSSYIHPGSGETIDDTSIQYLTVDASESGYKLIEDRDINGNPIMVYYYQIQFTVNANVRNAHEIVIVPQLLVKFDESGPSSERGTSWVKQEQLRLQVDGSAPDSPVLDPSVGLGQAVASGSWYTVNDVISLNILSSATSAQSREYIYAYICRDPALININVPQMDPTNPLQDFSFAPLRNDKIEYVDSDGQSQLSEVRQEITFYEQISPGRYTLVYRPVTFINTLEQALVLYRVDAAGNVSIPSVYYQNDNNKVKVDSTLRPVGTNFLIGREGDLYSQELSTNPIAAANIDFFAGPAYHMNDGTFLGATSYGYISTYETSLKRDQWVTMRISTTAAQASAYKLIRYKNEEAEIDFYSDSMVFQKGPLGRPDYIDITFKITDAFVQSPGVFFFYFRKNLDVNVMQNSFVFNQGRTIGIDDYIESYDGSQMVTGLTYSVEYFHTYFYNVVPLYSGETMQPNGSISIDGTGYEYTGMLALGNTITITATEEQFYVLRFVKQVVDEVTIFRTTFYKIGSGVPGGMVDVGEYYYKVAIELSSTALYFGHAEGFFEITKADPEVSKLEAKNTITYGEVNPDTGKSGLDLIEFISYDQSDVEIDETEFSLNGINYYRTKSGVWGSYEIIDPVRGTQLYNYPDVSDSMRIEVRFNPIPLTDSTIFTQDVISNNASILGQFYDNINGDYVIKTGAYHSGNFSSNTYVIYVTIVNAEGDVVIQDSVTENNTEVLTLEYNGAYKDIVFVTSPQAYLPVTYSFTLVDQNNNIIYDETGNPHVYTRINNAGRYRVNYEITATECNYKSDSKIGYVVINKRMLDLVPVNYNSMPPEIYEGIQFDYFYGIKYGKTNAANLPKPESYIQEGGDLLHVAYLYSYKMIMDYNGIGTVNPQYSDFYLGSAFPQTIDVGTYLLKIRVNDANNQGEIIVLTIINQVIKSDIIQAIPVPRSNYEVYNKEESLQSYLGDATQGHIEFGQTLLSQTDIMLGHLSPTAIYKIGNQNTTISG